MPNAGDPPPVPDGFDLVTWFDLSPLRPDEFDRANARRWSEVAACRAAYEMGIRDAIAEQHAYRHALALEPQA